MAFVKKNTHALCFVALLVISSAFLSCPATAGRDITSRDIDPAAAFGLLCFPLSGCLKDDCQKQCKWQGYDASKGYCDKNQWQGYAEFCCCKS